MTTTRQHVIDLGIRPVADSYCPISPRDISYLEQSLGYKIPSDYANFAVEFGEAYFPAGNVCITPQESPCSGTSKDGSLESGVFLGGEGCDYDLESYREIMSDRISDHYLPICIDPGGNYFVLDLGDTSVQFWCNETESFTMVADSFEAFLIAHSIRDLSNAPDELDASEKLIVRMKIPDDISLDDEAIEAFFDRTETVFGERLSVLASSKALGGDWDDAWMNLFISTTEVSTACELIISVISTTPEILDATVGRFDLAMGGYRVSWPLERDGECIHV